MSTSRTPKILLETRNILVTGVWSFVIIWMVASFLLDADLLFAFLLFFVAIAVSVAATALGESKQSKKEKETRHIQDTASAAEFDRRS